VSGLVRRAILALAAGEVLDPARLDSLASVRVEAQDGLGPVFAELERRFVRGAVSEPLSFYFSLGERERWTLRIDAERCRVTRGKPEGAADCVLKTSPEMFRRIVREAYTPSPSEFFAGTVKSNNIELLLVFQRAFRLSEPLRPAAELGGVE
jgi:long-chain acyl-CoA synthetase